MNISASKNLCLELTPDISLMLSNREAYCVMLFCTAYNWKDEGHATYSGSMLTPIRFRSIDDAWPVQNVDRFKLTGTLRNANELTFIFGPMENQRISVSRIQLLKMLNYYFRDNISRYLLLPDILPTPPENKIIPTGIKTDDGCLVGLYTDKYMNFVTYEEGSTNEPLPLTDTELFYGNQNLSRPEYVSIISLPSRVYTGGYRGKELLAAMQFIFSGGQQMLLEQ